MKSYDLVVAGAGPAGLTLAWKAAEEGLSVFVFDKKSEAGDVSYTTSGSFIDLDRWGLPREVCHPITDIHFASPNYFVERSGSACVIDRRRLLDELERRCIASGATLDYGTYARHVDVRDNNITCVCLDKEVLVEGEVYADCSGIGGVFNKRLPINTNPVRQALGFEYIVPLKSEPHLSELYVGGDFPGGYGWLFPVSEEKAIVGVGTLNRMYFPNVRDYLDRMMTMPRISRRVENRILESHSGVFNTGSPLRKFNRGNLILVGDVALQGNPVAGEGVRFVMDSADMAAKAVVDAVSSRDTRLLEGYSSSWVGKYYSTFQTGYVIQKLLTALSTREGLLDWCVKAGGKASDRTWLTLLRGEADYKFIMKKLPKLMYKPFIKS
ncbi:MAG: NAD(P)/FAD-dependent oxidoreductase [Candidatus Altiarchaeota archaeon]